LDAAKLSPGLIKEKYGTQFKNFHLDQNAQIVKVWVEMVRKKNPRLQAIVCSGHVPYDRDSAIGYIEDSGTDPRLWDDVVDQHMPMMYFNGFALCKDIEKTVEVLKKPVVPLLGTGWEVGLNRFTPDQTELNVLACLLGRTNGYGFFIGFVPWDALYWDKLARLSHLAAKIEDTILDGVDLTGTVNITGVNPESKYCLKIYKSGGKIVVGMINYSNARVSPKIDLSSIASSFKITVLYNKGMKEKDIALSGTTLGMTLGFEEAVFCELTQQRNVH
jgi:hypothetical protein